MYNTGHKNNYIYKEIQTQLLKCIKAFDINICYINIKYYQKSKIKQPYLRKSHHRLLSSQSVIL